MRETLRHLMKSLGLSSYPGDIDVLIYCIDREGQVVKVRDIYKDLELDRSETYKRTDRLIKMGLVIDSSYPNTPMRQVKAITYQGEVWEKIIEQKIKSLNEIRDNLSNHFFC